MSRLVCGKHLKVHERNIYFSHVTAMLMYYYDTPEYDNTAIILGDYVTYPIEYFRVLYPGSKILIYQLEQLVGGSNWHPVDRTIENIKGADEIWDFDAYNIAYLAWRKIEVDKLRPMRFTPSLHRIPLYQATTIDQPDIDVLFYGYANEKRSVWLDKIQKFLYGRGNFVHVFGIFGPELDALIKRSKIILNLHAFEPFHRQEQVRIFYPLINSKCVLSEKSQGNWFSNSIIEFTERDLGLKLNHCLTNWNEIADLGGQNFANRTSANQVYLESIADYAKDIHPCKI
jgi:hypothetical protein